MNNLSFEIILSKYHPGFAINFRTKKSENKLSKVGIRTHCLLNQAQSCNENRQHEITLHFL